MPHELIGEFFPGLRTEAGSRKGEKSIADDGGGTAPGVVDAQGSRVSINRHPLDVSGAGFFS
jgi:hypothetical protein